MSPHAEPNYQIMSKDDVVKMYQDTILEAQKKAELFYAIYQNKICYSHKKEKIINILKNAILLCGKYNLNENEYLFKIIQTTDAKEANQIVIEIRNKIHETEKNLKSLEQIGIFRRILYGIEFPEIFQQKSRIYLRTKPILSETELMQDIVDYLNYPLLKNERFSFFIETIPAPKENQSIDGEKKSKRIWLKQKQPMKPVAKLKQYELECAHFLKIIQENEVLRNDFFRFITKIPNDSNLALYFSRFKKKKNFPPLRLDHIFLRHLISYQLKDPNQLLSALQNIIQKLSFFHTELHEMLIKPLTDPETSLGIDTIILSTDPQDISSMSTFVQWESCMTNGGAYFQDIMMQIGTGSIIAYGVNSKNPRKKLARILLKPFETAKTLRQRAQYLQTVDFEAQFPYITVNKNLLNDYADMNLIKKQFLEEETSHLDDEDLILDPFNVERIYKIDKIYGLQNQTFKTILEEFINDHLNTKNVPGTYMIVDSMYLDSLQQSYQIYDKYDRDNLIKYLINNKISYNFDSKGVIHTTHLNLCDIPNLHLRPLHLESLALTGNMLNQEVKFIEVENLFIEQADTFKRKTFSKNIHISRKLSFEQSEKQFDMPFGIVAPSVYAEMTKLISVAPDIKTDNLIIPQTLISTIPPLTLKTLDISKCKRLKILPQDIIISDKLDASESNIQTLPALETNVINVNNTPFLKSIHENIKFLHFKAINSGLSSIPKNLKGISFNATRSKITEMPEGTSFDEIYLDETPLTHIHETLKTSTLSISNTPISFLPNGLKLYKLNAEKCKNLKELPEDIIVEGTLNLSESNISKLPVLKTQNIHLIMCSKIKKIEKGTQFQNLFAIKSSLQRLPENIMCNIILCNQSQLEYIPNQLQAYSVDARHTPLQFIGENVTINNLNISHTPICEISPSLQVENLEAINCKNLSKLNLLDKKTKKIDLMGSGIQELNHIDTKILNINSCQNINHLNNTVRFNILLAEESNLQSLPNNLSAQEVNVSKCPINKLPQNINLDKLDVSHTQVQEIPYDIHCHELILNNTMISVIPSDIQVSCLSLVNTPVQTIYYSSHIEEIIVNKPVKFIHPCISNEIIKGMTLSQIKQAKHNFKQRYKHKKLISSQMIKQSEKE